MKLIFVVFEHYSTRCHAWRIAHVYGRSLLSDYPPTLSVHNWYYSSVIAQSYSVGRPAQHVADNIDVPNGGDKRGTVIEQVVVRTSHCNKIQKNTSLAHAVSTSKDRSTVDSAVLWLRPPRTGSSSSYLRRTHYYLPVAIFLFFSRAVLLSGCQ